jgi:hypothetical protein
MANPDAAAAALKPQAAGQYDIEKVPLFPSSIVPFERPNRAC